MSEPTTYDFAALQEKWLPVWQRMDPFRADRLADPETGADDPRERRYLLDMFPYPSGDLHMGHGEAYAFGDLLARYWMQKGYNVLHPIGWDAFGLPAENAAIRRDAHPAEWTYANIATQAESFKRYAVSFDWSRRLESCDPSYYRWTQWLFLRFYERGLAYRKASLVNWCPEDQTVLANEQVVGGRCERCGAEVTKRELTQWYFKITDYAQRLLDDMAPLEGKWPERVLTMQRNWIGRSEGAYVDFRIEGREEPVTVFTTRPDTLFGATFFVVAPESALAREICAPEQREAFEAYLEQVKRTSEIERLSTEREKTGVFLGVYAINPVNGKRIPVYAADYVLADYGTGAIMAVPGQDQRDWEFAEKFGLPIIRTVQPPSDDFEGPFLDDGPAINSANDSGLDINGLGVEEAKKAVIAWLESNGHGEGTVQYKLRDWLFARQRYWGEPFPIVYDVEGIAYPLPESMLPVELPEVDEYSPTTFDPEDADSEPSPPLAKATDWVEVELDLGDGPRPYRRDTNVMPQWAGSCWYQLRYVDPTNDKQLVDPENERYWMGPRPEIHGPHDPGGLDLYIGGVEHAVLHLLYARFWHKVLYDLGHVSSEEPYRRLFNQGYIQAYAYRDARGSVVPADEVEERDGKFFYNGEEVFQEYGKMGKSLKNIVTPDEMFERFGADTFRFYEMSMGPFADSRPWSTKDVVGAHRFLQRLWRLIVDESTGEVRVTEDEPTTEDLRALHKAIAGVREDYDGLRFNTAGAKLIELCNYLTKHYGAKGTPRALAEPLVLMLAPLCPHICEELWSKLGHDTSLVHGPFPEADEQYLVDDTVDYPIQVNGKVRSRMTVPADASEDQLKEAALADEKIAALLEGQEPRKVIVVPGRLVNVVK